MLFLAGGNVVSGAVDSGRSDDALVCFERLSIEMLFEMGVYSLW